MKRHAYGANKSKGSAKGPRQTGGFKDSKGTKQTGSMKKGVK